MSTSPSLSKKTLPRRECFVTIGATATFTSILDAAISPAFLSTLESLEYTHLTLQCGTSLSYLRTSLSKNPPTTSLTITPFDFNTRGLGHEMRGCKAKGDEVRDGCVISHAGAGTILDAMRIGVRLIVVPNEELLDNHQEELAEELQKQGYVVKGRVDDLSEAVRRCEERGNGAKSWANVGREGGVMGIVDEELGYEEEKRRVLD